LYRSKSAFVRSVLPVLLSPPGLHDGGIVLSVFLIFNDFCQNNYLNIDQTDLRQICRVGRSVAEMNDLKLFFDPSRDVAMATNFCWFYRVLCAELGSRDIR